jgi:predicted membrane-bound spermidine synthase
MAGATTVRLALSTLILGLPTFLMGGTLPAAALSSETDNDLARRHAALLYGANTLGAVLGAFAATFWMLEIFGTRNTLWLACGFNALVAMTARSMSRSLPPFDTTKLQQPESVESESPGPPVSARFVYAAAAVVGFAFLLMELVWFRMLGSILGGTTYTFGLILVVALFGIGIGGALYAVGRGTNRPTLTLFTMTCTFEALFIGLPLALGDRIAVVTGLLQPLAVLGFAALVIAWLGVAIVVILPAAVVAGYQFPLLISLLGTGRTDVGRHVGTAYAWNTAGAIAGSIIGGFVLIPYLTAPGCWRLAIGLLVTLALVGMFLAARQKLRPAVLVTNGLICLLSIAFLGSDGPTAVWRHSGIGGQRVNLVGADPNGLKQWAEKLRRTLAWEAEGLEMSVGLIAEDGLSFIVNGKNDGNARGDASTQVGSGLISAALHPNPTSALVVGLGTGSTAGWLGRVSTMERVDVVELEPAIVEVARRCGPVNAELFENDKIRIVLADGREVLRTTPLQYDLIVSEPSNPYRAGIASLYTTEFYRAVADRLRPGGIFTQWMQAYEVDTQTIRTVIATLASVFSTIDIWQTNGADLVFLCSLEDRGVFPVDQLRSRLVTSPYREAFAAVWGIGDVEGFLSHFVASAPYVRQIAARSDRVNTDDRMLVEFAFARSVGRRLGFRIADVHRTSADLGLHRPATGSASVDWGDVEAGRVMMHALLHRGVPPDTRLDARTASAARAYAWYIEGDLESVREAWSAGDVRLRFPFDVAIVADALADVGNPAAPSLIERLRPDWPLDSKAIESRYLARQGEVGSAVSLLDTLFVELRTNPWIQPHFLETALDTAEEIGVSNPELAGPLFAALENRFAVAILNERRLQALLAVASAIGPETTRDVLHQLEPHVPWEPWLLRTRLEVYEATGDPRAPRARRDLAEMMARAPEGFHGP